jgi:peptidyl-prolyl cis-trans isomerase C
VKAKKIWVVAILAALVAAGCGPREPIVARAGSEKITLSEFKAGFIQRFYGEERAKQRPYQDREKFVRDLCVERAKYQEGLALGLDKKPDVQEQLEQVARRKALDLLYEDKVINAVATDQAAKEFYDMSGVEVKARHILLKITPADTARGDTLRIKARIDSIKQAIDHGLSFKLAAKLFSEDASSAADSGDVGYFPWGRMVDEFQRACWAAKPGVMTAPIRTPYGYHLILVEDKRPVADRRPFEEMKEKIKQDLRQVENQKMMDVARKYVDNLHKANKLEYKNEVLENFRKRVLDPAMPKGENLAPSFPEDQKKQIVATYKGGQVTVADLIEKIGATAGRVNWSDKQVTTDLVNAIVEPKLLEKDAEDKGFYRKAQRDPAVLDQKRKAMVGQLEKQEVTDKIKPTDADLHNYYESHLANFIQPEMRTVREIFFKSDSLKAVRVRARAVHGEDFKKLALRFNEKESTQPDTGRIGPFVSGQFGLTGAAIFALQKVGDISDLQRVGKNFAVVQLIGITPSRTKTYEEAQAEVMRQLRQQLTDDATKALEKRCTDKYKIDIDAKVLTAVWPMADKPKDKVAREP